MRELIIYLQDFHFASVLVRLLLATFLGGMVGLERERKHRPAGFRTYMLVCVGACLAMMLGQYEYTMMQTDWAAVAAEVGIKTDVSRFGAQVINGIGFLGAGTIILNGRRQIKGLTTAAGLWACACMGLAIGAGFYWGVLLAFVLVLCSVRFLPALDAVVAGLTRDMNVYVVFESMDDIGEILDRLTEMKLTVNEVEVDHSSDKHNRPGALLSLYLGERIPHDEVLTTLSEMEHIIRIEEI